MEDMQLLLEYAAGGSQRAFASLVERHINLVYSAAMRQIHDRHGAEDVTQAVFAALAAQARKLRKEAVISGWLLVTTRHKALDWLKAESRRKRHEMQAAKMRKEQQPQTPPEWEMMAPHLDAAIASLSTADRDVIMLRFFENLGFEEVAARLGLTPPAARQRAHRAVERVLAYFARAGIEVSAATLGPVVGACAIQTAPHGLATNVASFAASAKAAGIGIFGGKGAAVIMASTKLKIAAGIAAGIVLVGGGAVAWTVSAGRPRPVESGVQQSPAQPAPVPAWRQGFDRAYALAPGQVLRIVPPPFVPERNDFWESQRNRFGGASTLERSQSLSIAWGAEPRLVSVQFTTAADQPYNSLPHVLSLAASITSLDLDASVPTTSKFFAGDLIFRPRASVEQVMQALAPLVSQKLGRPVRFERKQARVAVIVAHWSPTPDTAPPPGGYLIESGSAPPSQRQHVSRGTLASFLKSVEEMAGQQIVDQTGHAGMTVRWDVPYRRDTDQLLKEIEDQSPLRFTRELRGRQVWSLLDSTPTSRPTP